MSAVDLRASIDLALESLAETCAGNAEIPDLDPYLDRIMNAVGNYTDAIIARGKAHREERHPRTTGPALTYTHSDSQTFTAVDLSPVSVDDTAPNRRRERALCRALLVEALRLMDTTETTTATCGAVRTEHQWYDGDRRTFGSAFDWPCVLTPAHSGDHRDKDGDPFQ
jgi:hypothetical protein